MNRLKRVQQIVKQLEAEKKDPTIENIITASLFSSGGTVCKEDVIRYQNARIINVEMRIESLYRMDETKYKYTLSVYSPFHKKQGCLGKTFHHIGNYDSLFYDSRVRISRYFGLDESLKKFEVIFNESFTSKL